MSLSQFLKIIFGFSLGLLIPYFLFINHNTFIKGPDSSIIQEMIFSNNNVCYRMVPYPILSKGEHL